MKLLCTADLHLGRHSACLAPVDADISALGAWGRICIRALQARADAVVIAGDLFDSFGSWYESRDRFLTHLKPLHHADIPVVAVCGNHDYLATARLARS